MKLHTKSYAFKVKKFEPLSDTQWANIQDLVEKRSLRGCPRRVDLRKVLDGLFHMIRTGCQWRNTDQKYGKSATLYYYFSKWKKAGTWDVILKRLVLLRRKQIGRNSMPSLGAIDSQSVKIVPLISQSTGIDGNKKINGRKRHIIVDSQGLPLAIHVSAAHENDGKAGIECLAQVLNNYETIQIITTDSAYKNTFEKEAKACGISVEISQKPPSEQGFVPQKNRWQVERSFSWLNFYRRLAKDYEKTIESSVAMIRLAFISLILNNF